MLIGIPQEGLAEETRVAAMPDSVGKIRKLGYYVVVESGAGWDANLADEGYAEVPGRLKRC